MFNGMITREKLMNIVFSLENMPYVNYVKIIIKHKSTSL